MVDEITYSDKGYYSEPFLFYTPVVFSRPVFIFILQYLSLQIVKIKLIELKRSL